VRTMVSRSIVALAVTGLLVAVWATRSHVPVGSTVPRVRPGAAARETSNAAKPAMVSRDLSANGLKPTSAGVHGARAHPDDSSAPDTRLADGYLLLLFALANHGARGAH